MKSLVCYSSKTGNTKKVAEAVYEALPEPKHLRTVDEVENVEDYDKSLREIMYLQALACVNITRGLKLACCKPVRGYTRVPQ